MVRWRTHQLADALACLVVPDKSTVPTRTPPGRPARTTKDEGEDGELTCAPGREPAPRLHGQPHALLKAVVQGVGSLRALPKTSLRATPSTTSGGLKRVKSGPSVAVRWPLTVEVGRLAWAWLQSRHALHPLLWYHLQRTVVEPGDPQARKHQGRQVRRDKDSGGYSKVLQ